LGFVEIPDEYRNWEGGTAQALAQTASDICKETGTPDEITERHVRYYVSSGLVDPPKKKSGREKHFSVRQLTQVLVARKLLSSLTQSQVREIFQTIDWDQAEGPNPAWPHTRTAAEELVAQFRGSAHPVQQFLATKLLRQSAQRVAGGPITLVRWQVRPWCEVLADPNALENLTDEQAQEVGREIAAVLTQLRNKNGLGGTT